MACNGKDAPREYGPYKTLYNRFVRWSRLGVFNTIFAELAKSAGSGGRIMIDAMMPTGSAMLCATKASLLAFQVNETGKSLFYMTKNYISSDTK